VNPWRARLNRWRRHLVQRWLYRIVFGEHSQGEWRPYTRISPATCIEHEDMLALGDHVYIGPFNFIEASGGVVIEEGVQITSHCSIVTHSSHRAMRLLGRDFVHWPSETPSWLSEGNQARPGWISGPVQIGAYSFIGPHSLIEAGTVLGRGTIVCAHSVVRGEFTDFAVLEGNPARLIGDSRRRDQPWLQAHPELRESYEAWAGTELPAEEAPRRR